MLPFADLIATSSRPSPSRRHLLRVAASAVTAASAVPPLERQRWRMGRVLVARHRRWTGRVLIARHRVPWSDTTGRHPGLLDPGDDFFYFRFFYVTFMKLVWILVLFLVLDLVS
jgi:hypothetical protein